MPHLRTMQHNELICIPALSLKGCKKFLLKIYTLYFFVSWNFEVFVLFQKTFIKLLELYDSVGTTSSMLKFWNEHYGKKENQLIIRWTLNLYSNSLINVHIICTLEINFNSLSNSQPYLHTCTCIVLLLSTTKYCF